MERRSAYTVNAVTASAINRVFSFISTNRHVFVHADCIFPRETAYPCFSCMESDRIGVNCGNSIVSGNHNNDRR